MKTLGILCMLLKCVYTLKYAYVLEFLTYASGVTDICDQKQPI